MIRGTVLIATLALAGCATTIPPQEQAATCRNIDWAQFGENDGILGVPVSEREARFFACADVGEPADLAAYTTGRAKGLETYCTPENGLKVGLEGREYRNVCPPELETAFLQGLTEGRKAAPTRVAHGHNGYRKGVVFGPKVFVFGKRFGFRNRFGFRSRFHKSGRFHRRSFRRHH